MALQVATVSAIIRISLSTFDIEKQSVASPEVVGRELAQQVNDYVLKNNLGYYPALDYFIDNDAIEADLLPTIDGIAWVVANMARDEVQRRLRPVFSTVKFENIQNIAYILPPVRPGKTDSIKKLAEHYTPDKVKISLSVTLVRKKISVEAAEQFCKVTLNRWLSNRFESLEISNVISLDRE